MKQFLRWSFNRGVCIVHGHDLEPSRIFYPPAKATVPGYRCERCGKTQAVLYRWQKVSTDE